jgi:hypothetical protein
LTKLPFNFFNNFSIFEAGIFSVDWRQISQYNYRYFEEKIEGFIKGRIGGFFRQILRAATIKILNSLLNFLTDS